MAGPSVFEVLSDQLNRLCALAEVPAGPATGLLRQLLGPAAGEPADAPPPWASDVADDHTPVEFSLAFGRGSPPVLRILAEAYGTPPGRAANHAAGFAFVRRQAQWYDLPLHRFDKVADLFEGCVPDPPFGLWHSLVFRGPRTPEFKVYFNPELAGVDRSAELTAEAMGRLGLTGAYRAALDAAVRPGELARRDRLSFFALDLHELPYTRVKVYVSHHDATVDDVVRAATAVPDLDPAEIEGFCGLAGGGTATFADRPLISSYTFAEGYDRPVGYSVYVPLRSYVRDDEEARERVARILHRHGFDPAELDKAVAAVARRPLGAGPGLLAHVSLRAGAPRPGITVYLSAEAHLRDGRPAHPATGSPWSEQ